MCARPCFSHSRQGDRERKEISTRRRAGGRHSHRRAGDRLAGVAHRRVPLLGTSSDGFAAYARHCFCEAVAHRWPRISRDEKLASAIASCSVWRFHMSNELSENPFCTRRVRPGAIPFLFPPGEDAETLVWQLQRNGWWGAIVGAHGTGKSALLATLIPQIELAGQHATLVELHDGQRRLPLNLGRDSRLRPPMVLIVDGYEQLSRWRRFLLKRHCRSRGLGLLVTAHAPVGLPELYRTEPTPELAERIVGQLMAGRSPPFTASQLAACFARHRGNVRETLFDLYDLYEHSRSS